MTLINGGTSNALAEVKPGSTLPSASDTALVVTVRDAIQFGSIAAGSNTIGGVTQSGTWTVSLATESIEIGKVDQGAGGSSAWKVDGSAVIQPVSGSISVSNFPATQTVGGTITANAGTNLNTSLLSLDTTTAGITTSLGTDGSTPPSIPGTGVRGWLRSLYDQLHTGTSSVSGSVAVTSVNGSVAVTGSFFQATQPVSGSVSVSNFPATQPISGAVTISGTPTVSVSNFPSTQAVTGTFFQATQPISGTVTANQGGAPWSENISQFGGSAVITGTGISGAGIPRVTVSSDSFPATQVVSGTVTANIGTADGLAQDSTLTSGSAKTQVTNFPASQAVTGTFFQATQPVSGTITANAGTGLFSVRGAPNVSTYSGNTAAFTPVVGDIFQITGSATKTIKILRIILSGTQTTAGNVNTVSIIKRSTADTGGTAVPMVKVPFDSSSPASTATAQHYTAAPTPGTTVGTLWGPRVTIPAPATVSNAGESGSCNIFTYDHYSNVNGQLPTLRGAAEALCINLSSVPTGAATFEIQMSWTEE